MFFLINQLNFSYTLQDPSVGSIISIKYIVTSLLFCVYGATDSFHFQQLIYTTIKLSISLSVIIGFNFFSEVCEYFQFFVHFKNSLLRGLPTISTVVCGRSRSSSAKFDFPLMGLLWCMQSVSSTNVFCCTFFMQMTLSWLIN